MRLRAFILALWSGLAAVQAQSADRFTQLAHYADTAAASLAPAQRAALAAIEDVDRRRLAMTFYLRAGATIDARWAWSAARIDSYRESPEYAAALAEIDKIAAAFARENPGYVLYSNTEIRSLEQQLDRWQTVRSVGVAADELKDAMLAHLADDKNLASQASHDRFREFLIRWRASRAVTLAAPGMSLHGQGRAYDFQVRDQKGRTIAGPESASIATVWRGHGWAERVARAVRTGSASFSGPLTRPDEPWHFEYRP
jgi:hypothetical protein